MHASVNKEGITFSAQGDVDAGSLTRKPRGTDTPEEVVSRTVHAPVTATFVLC